jgi:AraC family transcriptional regulator of adaptative response/methylated-DNA-[protein]-cysteine methyltransferase
MAIHGRSDVSLEHTAENPIPTDQTRWEAIVQRNRQADGVFVYGVLTTGVYCRPGCPSRLPDRENVRFFDTSEEAERAGFRPCKRCSPNAPERQGTHAEAIVQACKTIEESEEPPSLNELAEAAGLSPFYFHRLFKKIVGVTPKQYALQKRLNRVRAHLQQGSTVTEAVYEAGFASSSRFYHDTTTTLGMKPTDYKNGAHGMYIRYAIARSYLGWVLVAATAQGICTVDFGDSPEILKEGLRARFPKAELQDSDPGFDALVAKVLAFIESPHLGFDLPLDIQGTAFQRRVWKALQEIPAGTTTSYSDIAARIGQPKAARAVAQACAANTIAVAIPCHRVRRGDGEPGGYRWGVERKRALLERESDQSR